MITEIIFDAVHKVLNSLRYFDVLLTVHLSTFISVFNQLDAQNFLHNKFYFMPLHVSSTCAHHQEVETALHSLWYHHTYRCDDTRGCVMQRRLFRAHMLIIRRSKLHYTASGIITPIGVMIPEAV